MYHLIVVHEFGSYTKGQMITDEAEVLNVLAGDNAHYVVKIAAPAAPAPAATDAAPEVAPLTPAGQ